MSFLSETGSERAGILPAMGQTGNSAAAETPISTWLQPGDHRVERKMKPSSTVSVVAPFQTIFFHKHFKLLAESSLSMMAFLARNVRGNLIDV